MFLSVLHLAEFVMHFLPGNPYNITVDSIFSYIADFLVSFLIFRFIQLVSNKQDKKDKNAAAKDGPSVELKENTEEAVLDDNEIKTDNN